MDSEEVEIIAETRHFNSKEALAWEGLELAPLKIKQGLLGTWLDPIMKQPEKRKYFPRTNGPYHSSELIAYFDLA